MHTHTAVAVQPLKLSELIIIPEAQNQSDEGNITEILTLLSSSLKLIRRGSVFSVPLLPDNNSALGSHANTLSRNFLVISTEPALQGYVDSTCTRLILLSNNIPSTHELSSNGFASYEASEISTESESEILEIRQNFLENELTNTCRSELPQSSNSIVLNGTKSLKKSPVIISCHGLTRQINETERCGMIDGESSLFLNEIPLSQVGVFDGDWVSYLLSSVLLPSLNMM